VVVGSLAACDVRLFSTAVLVCSRSGRRQDALGDFFLRDFDLGIGDGLLRRRRQLLRRASLRRFSGIVCRATVLPTLAAPPRSLFRWTTSAWTGVEVIL
jgi:hypothetical protein